MFPSNGLLGTCWSLTKCGRRKDFSSQFRQFSNGFLTKLRRCVLEKRIVDKDIQVFRYASGYIADPENKGQSQTGVNFDTLGSWNNRMALPILYEQSVKKGKIIPRVPLDEVGLATAVGRRKVNEDRYVMKELKKDLLYFGVFDGHGGSFTADYAATHLVDHMNFWMSQTDRLDTVLRRSFSDMNNILSRHLTFYHLDNNNFKTGTTATVCLLRNSSELIVAHVGDSLALLCRNGKPLRLSEIHDPENGEECSRIIDNGGRIIPNSHGTLHVNGRLAMTRSLGDMELKSFGVTASPQIRSIEVKHAHDAFLVLCSDGLTYAITEEEMTQIVSNSDTPQEATNRLADQAQHFGSEDNITVMVIPLGAWGKYQNSAHLTYHFGRSLMHSRFRGG